MWQNIFNKGRNLYRKAKDVVTTVGNSVVQKAKAVYNNCVSTIRKTAKAILVAVGISTAVIAPSAHSAVPEGVTTAITGAATDVATVGAAVILVIIGIKVWKWIQRAF